jgi:hypothetical protein
LVQIEPPAGARRAFNGKCVSVVGVIVKQGTQDQEVNRHPDRAAPVGIAAEHAGIGFGREIVDSILAPPGAKDVGMVGVPTRERADAMRTEELVLVEHDCEYPAKLALFQNGEEPSLRPPTPIFLGSWNAAQSSGRVSGNQWNRSMISGYTSKMAGSKGVAAQKGSRPTI